MNATLLDALLQMLAAVLGGRLQLAHVLLERLATHLVASFLRRLDRLAQVSILQQTGACTAAFHRVMRRRTCSSDFSILPWMCVSRFVW